MDCRLDRWGSVVVARRTLNSARKWARRGGAWSFLFVVGHVSARLFGNAKSGGTLRPVPHYEQGLFARSRARKCPSSFCERLDGHSASLRALLQTGLFVRSRARKCPFFLCTPITGTPLRSAPDYEQMAMRLARMHTHRWKMKSLIPCIARDASHTGIPPGASDVPPGIPRRPLARWPEGGKQDTARGPPPPDLPLDRPLPGRTH